MRVKRKHRRTKIDNEETSRRQLLAEQRRFLEALELEKAQGISANLERTRSRNETKRARKKRRRAYGVVERWPNNFIIVQKYPGQGRLNRRPTASAPLSRREYERYINSPEWRDFVDAYKQNSSLRQECFVCGDDDFELHHRTYVRVGREDFEDVVPLCRTHHEACHRAVKARQTSLEHAHTYVKMRIQARQPIDLRVRKVEKRS